MTLEAIRQAFRMFVNDTHNHDGDRFFPFGRKRFPGLRLENLLVIENEDDEGLGFAWVNDKSSMSQDQRRRAEVDIPLRSTPRISAVE